MKVIIFCVIILSIFGNNDSSTQRPGKYVKHNDVKFPAFVFRPLVSHEAFYVPRFIS